MLNCSKTKILGLAIAGLWFLQPGSAGGFSGADASMVGTARTLTSNLVSLISVPPPRDNPRRLRQPVRQIGSIAVPRPKPRVRAFTRSSSAKKVKVSNALKSGMAALEKDDVMSAIAIRNGATDRLDRLILDWQILLSNGDVPHKFVVSARERLANWPSAYFISQRQQRSYVRAKPGNKAIANYFDRNKPLAMPEKKAAARAYIAVGNKSAAKKIVQPIWRDQRMDAAEEAKFLKEFRSVLSRDDHHARMRLALSASRSKSINLLLPLVDKNMAALANARLVVMRRKGGARAALNKVPGRMKKEPIWLFSSAQAYRRAGDLNAAGKALTSIPADSPLMGDPSEYWPERRTIARQLLEKGNPKLAYRVVAGQQSGGYLTRLDADFHAGWIALRFANRTKDSLTHFGALSKRARRPISQARGFYWLGRAQAAAGQTAAAEQSFSTAARHASTYYGQLAHVELGRRRLSISAPPQVTAADKQNFAKRDLVRAIDRLASAGYRSKTEPIFRHLGRELKSAGEIRLLADRAGRLGLYHVVIQVATLGNVRGLPTMALAYPTSAVPSRARLHPEVPKSIAFGISKRESNFNQSVVSRAGARGLFQVMPGTAKLMAKRAGVRYSLKKLSSDAEYNALLGTHYLAQMLDRYDGSYVRTFVAYNAGPGRSDSWSKRFGNPSKQGLHGVIDWVELIPFKETRNYVQRVMENVTMYEAVLGVKTLRMARNMTK